MILNNNKSDLVYDFPYNILYDFLWKWMTEEQFVILFTFLNGSDCFGNLLIAFSLRPFRNI